MSGVHSLLHLPVCAGGAGALLQPGHLLPVHQSEGGNNTAATTCDSCDSVQDNLQHNTAHCSWGPHSTWCWWTYSSESFLWQSLGFQSTSGLLQGRCADLERFINNMMVLFQIWVGHGFCHVSSHRVSAHLPWYCCHLQSDRNIALQILCHNLERGNRKHEVID